MTAPALLHPDVIEIEETALVRTLLFESDRDGHVWLLPQNEAYAPIPGDNALLLGRVVTVLRKL